MKKLLIDLKEKIKKLDDYKTRGLIDKKMDLGRYELLKARSDRLEVGLTVPQVEDLLGFPHEKILGMMGRIMTSSYGFISWGNGLYIFLFIIFNYSR